MPSFVKRPKKTENPAGGINPALEPNVSQYGWTSYDAANVNQLIEYVNLCKQYAETAQNSANYIQSKFDEIDTFMTYLGDLYAQIKPIADDIEQTHIDITQMHLDVIQSRNDAQASKEAAETAAVNAANSEQVAVTAAEGAKVSETNAKASEDQSLVYLDESKELVEELRKGQVYRGTWNPKTAAWPDPQGTNSVWDVVLDVGTSNIDYGGFTWHAGDRLLYIHDNTVDTQWDQLKTGSGVLSVNGKTGSVTLNATDVNAVALAGNSTVNGTVTATDLKARLTHSLGYMDVFPYGSTYDDGSRFRMYYRAHDNNVPGTGFKGLLMQGYTPATGGDPAKVTDIDISLNGRMVYHEGRKPSPQAIGALSDTTTVNGIALKGNPTLTNADIGSFPAAGGTLGGKLTVPELELSGPMTLNKHLIKGANGSLVMRDHGNGNVTISASLNEAGTAGDLYLGYTAGSAGTPGYNTRKVLLRSPMDWATSHSLVNGDGLLNSERMTGPIRTEKDSGNVYHTIVGGADTVNRGRTIIAAGECGRHIAENIATGSEQVHIGGDQNDGVFIHTGLQNGWNESTHKFTKFHSGEIYVGKGTSRVYHQGFKPTAEEIGAMTTAGGTITGPLTLANQIYGALKVNNQSTISYQDGSHTMFHIGSVGNAFRLSHGTGAENDLVTVSADGAVTSTGPQYALVGQISQSRNSKTWLGLETPENADPYISYRSQSLTNPVVGLTFKGDEIFASQRLAANDMRVTHDAGLRFAPTPDLSGVTWGAGINSSTRALGFHRYENGTWKAAPFELLANGSTNFNSNIVTSGAVFSGGYNKTSRTSSPIGMEMEIPGAHARMMWMDNSGNLNFSASNGAGAEASRLMHVNGDGLVGYGHVYGVPFSTQWGGTATFSGTTGGDFINAGDGSWFPLIGSATFARTGAGGTDGYTNKFQIGHYRSAGAHNGDTVLYMGGDGLLSNGLRFHFQSFGQLSCAGTSDGTHWQLGPGGHLYGSIFGGYSNMVNWCTASFAPISDMDYKDVIGDSTEEATPVINQLKFKKFTWKKGDNVGKTVEIGLIAQEIEHIDEQLVKDVKTFNPDGTTVTSQVKTLDTASLLTLALKSIQELEARIKVLEGKP